MGEKKFKKAKGELGKQQFVSNLVYFLKIQLSSFVGWCLKQLKKDNLIIQ